MTRSEKRIVCEQNDYRILQADAYVVTAVSCLVKNETRGHYRQKAYGDMFEEFFKTARQPFNRNFGTFERHWCFDEVAGAKYELSSRNARDSVIWMSRPAAKL